jgi:hypothetical protein
MLEKLAMITVPAAALIAVTADWTTAVLFGPQWSSAAPVVACFAIVAAYQPSIHVMGLLYMTQMRAAELVRASMLDAAISIVTVLCSLPYGTTAVAAAFAVTGLFMRTPFSYWLATRRQHAAVGDGRLRGSRRHLGAAPLHRAGGDRAAAGPGHRRSHRCTCRRCRVLPRAEEPPRPHRLHVGRPPDLRRRVIGRWQRSCAKDSSSPAGREPGFIP